MSTEVVRSSAPVTDTRPAQNAADCPPTRRAVRQPSSITGAQTEVRTPRVRSLRSAVVWLVLVAIYTSVAAICMVVPAARRRRRFPRRLCVTGTFHNANWYRAHITPLVRCGVQEVILVVDEPQAEIGGVRFVCPPRWVARIATRAGAKFLWMLWAGIRFRPDVYMGYHILPGAASALLAGRAFGAPAVYQMTGGPVEIDGGGAHSESWLTGSLAGSSSLLERLAVRVVRQFDAVIVRGKRAHSFLATCGVRGPVHIITGSVRSGSGPSVGERVYDLVYVGRLTSFKQPEQFVQIVAAVREQRPTTRAAVIGDGPLLGHLRGLAASLRLENTIDWLGKQSDPTPIVAKARTFVLTSRSEGLSIAMAEAMAAGVVPVVADVGELKDLVRDGENGYLVTPNDVRAFADRIESLLRDQRKWKRCARAAAGAAAQCRTEVVADKWNACLRGLGWSKGRTGTVGAAP